MENVQATIPVEEARYTLCECEVHGFLFVCLQLPSLPTMLTDNLREQESSPICSPTSFSFCLSSLGITARMRLSGYQLHLEWPEPYIPIPISPAACHHHTSFLMASSGEPIEPTPLLTAERCHCCHTSTKSEEVQ